MYTGPCIYMHICKVTALAQLELMMFSSVFAQRALLTALQEFVHLCMALLVDVHVQVKGIVWWIQMSDQIYIMG